MKKFLLVSVAIILVAVAGVAIWLHVPNPSLNGTQLNVLLTGLSNPKPDARERARQAMRQTDGKALPALLELIQSKDSPSQQTFTALVGLPYRSASERRLTASRGIAALVVDAKPLVPDLLKLLPDEVIYQDVVNALRSIGPEAVPELIEALSSPDHSIRMGAAAALGQSGSKAAAAVPVLVKLLKDPDADVRYWAVSSLGMIGLEGPTVVPALIPFLEAGQGETSTAAAYALGAFKAQAKEALPALKKAAKSKAQSTRDAAKSAILDIEASLVVTK